MDIKDKYIKLLEEAIEVQRKRVVELEANIMTLKATKPTEQLSAPYLPSESCQHQFPNTWFITKTLNNTWFTAKPLMNLFS